MHSNAAFPWAFSEAFDPTTPRGLSVPLRPAQALCEPAWPLSPSQVGAMLVPITVASGNIHFWVRSHSQLAGGSRLQGQ